jgi:hypothetical protein
MPITQPAAAVIINSFLIVASSEYNNATEGTLSRPRSSCEAVRHKRLSQRTLSPEGDDRAYPLEGDAGDVGPRMRRATFGCARWDKAKALLQRPLLDDALTIVMRGADKEDRQRHEMRRATRHRGG